MSLGQSEGSISAELQFDEWAPWDCLGYRNKVLRQAATERDDALSDNWCEFGVSLCELVRKLIVRTGFVRTVKLQ